MAHNWIPKEKPHPRRPRSLAGGRENPQAESASVGAVVGGAVVVVVAAKGSRLCRRKQRHRAATLCKTKCNPIYEF